MRVLSVFTDRVYLAAGVLSGVCLIGLCCLVLYSILARIIGLFAGGTTEFAGYTMAASTFFALAYTFRNNGHIRVQLLVQHLSGSSRRGLEILCLAIMSFATSFVAYYMIKLVLESYEYEERSEGADAILIWIPQTPLAIGAALLALAVLHTLLQALFDYEAIDPEHKGHQGPNEI